MSVKIPFSRISIRKFVNSRHFWIFAFRDAEKYLHQFAIDQLPGVATGGISAAVSSAREKKIAAVKAAEEKREATETAAEEHRHNLAMKKLAAEDFDSDSLYIYTTTPEQLYYQFLKALEYLPKKDVQDLFQYYEENEEEVEIKDIIDNYIEGKNPTDIKVFLLKNVNDLDLSNIDSKRKNLILFDDCVAQRNQAVQQEFFTKGRHHNCHCIYQSQSFYGMNSMFIRKNANCFLLFELKEKDLSQIIQSINHGMDRDTFRKVCKAQWRNPDDHGYVL
ncbi:hypothetical protein LOTGIDRAFT_170830 [Lottia gigantea]|uniref:TraD/TraG TraM recognition site domain-containing protein n=1 Tax=Lottia gigantea TaxID=225164 RepID=V4BF49_LOTGI|nr:hypothetical protein LOTGIDRAFT_170830 [Lottia gigantea]ESP04437.1 hypothetical protein LOTGIDRAFT_170830 [Lottia gigantea]